MDFTIKKGTILRELNLVQGVVERRHTIPILSNLLLEATRTGLSITATDMDVSIRCHCEAMVRKAGSLTVSAKKLFDIVRLLPETDISFKLADGESLAVTCEKSNFKLVGLPKDNFPAIPVPPWLDPQNEEAAGRRVDLPGGTLRKMIHRTIFAITQEESRYTLNGALLILRPDGLSVVTTDGHRLALISKPATFEAIPTEVRALIPRKTLVELLKLASDEEATISFGRDENHLFFAIRDHLLVSRVLAGQFPNYEMVLPKDNQNMVLIDRVALEHALRRADVMADEHSRAIRWVIHPDHLEVKAISSDTGEAHETLSLPSTEDAAAYQGDPVEMGFNAQYLLDYLAAVGEDHLALWFRDAETQILLVPATPGDLEYKYVVMPMRL